MGRKKYGKSGKLEKRRINYFRNRGRPKITKFNLGKIEYFSRMNEIYRNKNQPK